MNIMQIKEKLLAIVSEIVNSIANDTYENLETWLRPHHSSSWAEEELDTYIPMLKNFIQINYNGWAEDTGKEYKINTFTEQNISDDLDEIAEQLCTEGWSMLCYDLKTIDDDSDYFWLEIFFELTPQQEIKTTMDINF